MLTVNEKRILPIEGGYNFRDLGGIITENNRLIKSNYLIRTDELSGLTENDLNFLADLNVKSIVDFRTNDERVLSVDKIPLTTVNEFHLDIMAGSMTVFMSKMKSGTSDYKAMLHYFYTELITSENAIKEYKSFFNILQSEENCSVIYHCTAGKDRTGIATALILSALNVNSSVIEQDYMLSNQFLEKKYGEIIQHNPALKDLFLVQAEYLHGAFETINKNYYSVEDYLTSILNIDIDAMKKIYTE